MAFLKRLNFIFTTGVLLLLFLQSCRTTKHLKDGEFLVIKNQIHINDSIEIKSELKSDDFSKVIRQKPNRRLVGFIPFHLSVWNFAEKRKKDKKLNEYLRNTVGEEPVIYDELLRQQSEEQLNLLLDNNGYFEGSATADTSTVKERFLLWDKKLKKKVIVHYYINTGEAYRLNRVNFALENPDTTIISQLKNKESSLSRSLLNRGDRFEVDLFDDERARITKVMKNLGYYTFDKIHVIFDVDTSRSTHKFDVAIRFRNLRMKSQVNGKDSLISVPHRRFRVNDIYVNENFQGGSRSQVGLDTISYKSIDYLYLKKPIVKVSRIHRNIFIKKGTYYSLDKTNYTYERISALGTFKFIDIQYETSSVDSVNGLLDLRINLTEAPKRSITLEATGTNRSGNLGISTGVNFKNKNIFRGAEQFDLSVYTGVEAQRSNSTLNNDEIDFITKNTPFNTYEIGVQAALTIPDFIFSFTRKELPWFKEPKTNISFTADRQVRPQYDRVLFNLAYQMNMRIRDRDQLVVAPIDLSIIDLTKDADFERQLLRTRNSLLINSYNNHIIPAGRISYSYSSQRFEDLENYYRYKINYEMAGNIARLASKAVNLPYDAGRDSYLIDSIAFAQYVKLDGEYAKYYNLTANSSSAYRIIAGVGLPLKNLNTLPFDRSFFAGGANDMRAWQARALGPGSLSDTATYGIDQVGELKLELNLEYRFKIIKMLEGAIFTDIGNIWILQEDPQRPGAEFDPKTFYKELAIGPGIGARLDFGFFLLRLDAGLQVKDPNLPEGERWIFQPKTNTNALRTEANISRVMSGYSAMPLWSPDFTLNLGIDYPF